VVGKIAVSSPLKCCGKVYTAMIPDAQTETLTPVIEKRVELDGIVRTKTFTARNALDASGFRHHRISRSKAFALQTNHVMGQKTFLSAFPENGVPVPSVFDLPCHPR